MAYVGAVVVVVMVVVVVVVITVMVAITALLVAVTLVVAFIGTATCVPHFCCGVDTSNNVLLPSRIHLGFVPGAGVAQSCSWRSVCRGFRFLNSFFFSALAAASSICLHSSIFLLNVARDNSVPWHSAVSCSVSLRTSTQSITRLFISNVVVSRPSFLAAAIADGVSPSRS